MSMNRSDMRAQMQSLLADSAISGAALIVARDNSPEVARKKADRLCYGTDDEETLDDIITEMATIMGEFLLMPGIYNFGAMWDYGAWYGEVMRGTGREATILKYVGTAADAMLVVRRAVIVPNCGLRSLQLDCNSLTGGLALYRNYFCRYQDLYIRNVKTTGYGIYLDEFCGSELSDIQITGQGITGGKGLEMAGNNTGSIYRNIYASSFQHGIDGYLTQGCSIFHPIIETCETGIYITKFLGGTIIAPEIERNTEADIHLVGSVESREMTIMGGLLSGGYTQKSSGSHTGANGAAVLTDSGADFVVTDSVVVGDEVYNTTDNSRGAITAVTATTITATLAGGTDNDWDTNDTYKVGNSACKYGIRISGNVNHITLIGVRSIDHVIADLYIESGLTNLKSITAINCELGTIIDANGKLIQLGLEDDADGRLFHRVARATYDFDVDGGVQGSIGLHAVIPDNAFIINAWYEVLVTLISSGDNATVSLDIPTDDVAGILAAIAIDDGTNPWDAGASKYHACIQDGDPTNFSEKCTAAREISMTIAVEDLTAGKFVLWCEYVVSD